MIQNRIEAIVAFIVAAVLVFLLMKNCTGDVMNSDEIETPHRTVIVKLTTKIDTVWKKKYVYIHDTISKPTLIRIVDTVFVDNTKDIATIPAIKREYKDRVKVGDSTAITYTASTTGTLDNIIVEYEDKRAERTIIRTNTAETTITKQPRGLYIGIGSNLGLNELSPSIQYVNNKNMFGVKYNIAGTQTPLQNIGITYSRKLF